MSRKEKRPLVSGVAASTATADAPVPVPRARRAPRGPMGGPMGMGGPPVEKAKNFKGTLRRLLGFLRPYRLGITAVMIAAILSVAFSIAGPKILGRATNTLFDGVMSRVVTKQLSDAFGGTVP
ncbi:MAG TPA: hypothetical protein VIL27_02360, partial [Clostridia bacterium]